MRKQTLRKEAERVRRSASPIDLTDALAEWLSGYERVASYVAFGNEPSVSPRPGWLLPVLRNDDDLDWARYAGELAPGRRNLMEPVGPRLGIDAIAFVHLVLVPALLVDREGYRLGRGGGSYDRALRRTTGTLVAVLHDGELVDELPRESHDVPVHGVVTPSGGLVVLRDPGSGKMEP
ncbi:MAG TPA: 5-formyltetrahydrofolate cyclo-ligase [Mycobacteriales bacterium]|nr:5-formyltetrahydrofolate cyclo-ligase [Mycobacteriales bacterium]